MGHELRYSERHAAQGRDQPDEGEYRQFVSNRVHKIQQHQKVKWHHVPTTENPANLGSRRGSITDNQLWKQGPLWLSDSSKWPPGLVLEPCAKTKAELKVSRNILLDAHTLHKVLRIGAWIWRFAHNCQNPSAHRKMGPLDTTEIEQQKVWWIKRAQLDAETSDHFEEDKLQLDLQPNDQLILECRGRIQGEYPSTSSHNRHI